MKTDEHEHENSTFLPIRRSQICIGKDLAGFGDIVGHFMWFILAFIGLRASSRDRQLENEAKRLRNDAMRLENAFRQLALTKKYGELPEDLKGLVRLPQISGKTIARVSESSISKNESKLHKKKQNRHRPRQKRPKDKDCNGVR